MEAVAQTLDEPAGSHLRVGCENGHIGRRERPTQRKVAAHDGSGVHFRERAARFRRRLYATASMHSDSPASAVLDRSLEAEEAKFAPGLRLGIQRLPACPGGRDRGGGGSSQGADRGAPAERVPLIGGFPARQDRWPCSFLATLSGRLLGVYE
jgi:hypothetical protein